MHNYNLETSRLILKPLTVEAAEEDDLRSMENEGKYIDSVIDSRELLIETMAQQWD